MAFIRIHLDQEMLRALTILSLRECRPVDLEAKVLLRQALALPIPYPPPEKCMPPQEPAVTASGIQAR